MGKLLIALLCSSLVFAGDTVLPEGKGRDAVENACTVCHDAERIVKQSLTADQWRSEVRTMVENGASLNPEEWDPVVAYLTRNFGPKVEINKATAAEIAAALQLTSTEAEAIVKYRGGKGPFKDLKDLGVVPGFDVKKIAGRESRIAF